MRQVTVATLKLFGGHQALDFTNTVDSRGARYGPDVLQTYDDLLDWSVRLDVLETVDAEALRGLPREQGEAALARAKALREVLYRIFAAHPAAATADLDLLQREACLAQEKRMLVHDAGGFAWRWQAGDPDALSNRIACSAADLLTSPAFRRVRVCPGEDCGWLFLDNSRSGRRRWCSEQTCGMRSRVRRWRGRRRAEA